MSYVDEAKTLETYFASNWDYTPIDWENVEFDPEANTSFVVFRVVPGSNQQASIPNTNTMVRRYGVVEIKIMIQRNTGRYAINQYADTLISLFDRKRIGSIIMQTGRLTGVSEAGQWCMGNVAIPYYHNVFV